MVITKSSSASTMPFCCQRHGCFDQKMLMNDMRRIICNTVIKCKVQEINISTLVDYDSEGVCLPILWWNFCSHLSTQRTVLVIIVIIIVAWHSAGWIVLNAISQGNTDSWLWCCLRPLYLVCPSVFSLEPAHPVHVIAERMCIGDGRRWMHRLQQVCSQHPTQNWNVNVYSCQTTMTTKSSMMDCFQCGWPKTRIVEDAASSPYCLRCNAIWCAIFSNVASTH